MLKEAKDIAEVFNAVYTNIATDLDSNLPPLDTDPVTFLRGDYPAFMAVPLLLLET